MDPGGMPPEPDDVEARLAGPPVEQLTPTVQPAAVIVGVVVGAALVIGVIAAVVLLA